MPELLLEEEEIIAQYAKLIITTHRVIYEQNSKLSSMVLIENVSGISTKNKDYPIYLILGAITLFSGIYYSYFEDLKSNETGTFLIGAGIILILIYNLWSTAIINIKSDSGDNVVVPLNSYTKHEIETIICKIMIQKNIRLYNLYK